MVIPVQVQKTVLAVLSKCALNFIQNPRSLTIFCFPLHSSTRETHQFDINDNQTDLNLDDYQSIFRHVDLYNVENSTNFNYDNPSSSPYRKYIEHVLKSRGLGQSLTFLHHLYNDVLRKAHATLEVPGSEESDLDFYGFDENISHAEIPLNAEQEEELHRYGIWCEEAASLSLPSYVPAFVFLSVMPLEVMHEYLRMRLETKPMTPNPLSLEQVSLFLVLTEVMRMMNTDHSFSFEITANERVERGSDFGYDTQRTI